MRFQKGNQIRKGKASSGGRPAEGARKALADLLWDTGARQAAIDVLDRALKDTTDGKPNGPPTTSALRAAEYVLERSDPRKNLNEDIRTSGGDLNITVRWERAEKPG